MPSDSISSYRNTLHDGIRRFRQDVFTPNQQAYETAASTPQQPHTLVIACADSRVDPVALTRSEPGQIFVARNIGNLVPPYGSSAAGGVAAVIEYAVSALGVKQIVVCGHSDCGAMKGLSNRQSVATLPVVDRWLENADAAFSVIQSRHIADEKQRLLELTKENVLLQLQHLRTHPVVTGKLADGSLALYGWVYDIGAGQVTEYDGQNNRFEPI